MTTGGRCGEHVPLLLLHPLTRPGYWIINTHCAIVLQLYIQLLHWWCSMCPRVSLNECLLRPGARLWWDYTSYEQIQAQRSSQAVSGLQLPGDHWPMVAPVPVSQYVPVVAEGRPRLKWKFMWLLVTTIYSLSHTKFYLRGLELMVEENCEETWSRKRWQWWTGHWPGFKLTLISPSSYPQGNLVFLSLLLILFIRSRILCHGNWAGVSGGKRQGLGWERG